MSTKTVVIYSREKKKFACFLSGYFDTYSKALCDATLYDVNSALGQMERNTEICKNDNWIALDVVVSMDGL